MQPSSQARAGAQSARDARRRQGTGIPGAILMPRLPKRAPLIAPSSATGPVNGDSGNRLLKAATWRKMRTRPATQGTRIFGTPFTRMAAWRKRGPDPTRVMPGALSGSAQPAACRRIHRREASNRAADVQRVRCRRMADQVPRIAASRISMSASLFRALISHSLPALMAARARSISSLTASKNSSTFRFSSTSLSYSVLSTTIPKR